MGLSATWAFPLRGRWASLRARMRCSHRSGVTLPPIFVLYLFNQAYSEILTSKPSPWGELPQAASSLQANFEVGELAVQARSVSSKLQACRFMRGRSPHILLLHKKNRKKFAFDVIFCVYLQHRATVASRWASLKCKRGRCPRSYNRVALCKGVARIFFCFTRKIAKKSLFWPKPFAIS